MPGGSIATLSGHQRPINSIRWAPASGIPHPPNVSSNTPQLRSFRHVLMTGSDDCQVIVWDTSTAVQYPVLAGSTPSTSRATGGATAYGQSDSKDNYSIVAAYTHKQEVNGVAWSRDGRWAVVTSGRGVQAVSL